MLNVRNQKYFEERKSCLDSYIYHYKFVKVSSMSNNYQVMVYIDFENDHLFLLRFGGILIDRFILL